jgi:hypothetical protein
MGLWGALFGGDATRSWKRDPALSLEVVLEDARFSGVGFGDPVDAVARFGPPANPHALRDGVFRYEADGFEIDATRGRVDCFCFFWEPGRSFPGRFAFGGRAETFEALSRIERVKDWLGEPWWRDDDAEETILFYERPRQVEWQVEFRLDGTLKAFTVTTPPLLADKAQREAYGVTKPWPPRC